MPRIRSIHPEACDSEKLAALSDSAERTFFRLLTHTDDEGRGEDRPRLLAAKLYPLMDDKDADTVDVDLEDLRGVGLLLRYTVNDRRYYEIPTFGDWQKPRHPSASKCPSPDDPNASPTAERGNATANRRKPTAGVGVGGGGGGDDADKPPSSSSPDAVTEQFDDFWNRYPRHAINGKPGGGGSRKRAETTWRRLSKSKRDLALAAVDHYRAWCESPEGEYPAHASTWLNDERWEQWQEAGQQPHLRAVGDGEILPDGTTRGVM